LAFLIRSRCCWPAIIREMGGESPRKDQSLCDFPLRHVKL